MVDLHNIARRGMNISYLLIAAAVINNFFPSSGLATTYVVTNTNNSGSGSLRSAISQANSNPGADAINFNISGTAPFVIKPTTALPIINSPLTIDGTTQPGYAGSPLVEIDGINVSTIIGLEFTANNSAIIGLSVHSCNTGIVVNANGMSITNSWIGLDSAGVKKPNFTGLVVVKGTGTYSDNVVSGSTGTGMNFSGTTTGNTISNNIIGLDPTATLSAGNGIGIDLAFGTHTVSSNRIAANNTGVAIRFVSNSNIVTSNIIKSNFSGGGLTIASSSNTITTNVIGENSGAGVYIYQETGMGYGTMNTVLGNKIFDNGLNIELIDPSGPYSGLDPNDALDVDTGSNEHQNHPVLSTADNIAGQLNVVGVLDSAPSTTYTLEFFGSANPYSPVGTSVLGSMTVTTDAAGHASYTFLSAPRQHGSKVVATATDPLGNTSEYSLQAIVNGGGGPIIDGTI